MNEPFDPHPPTPDNPTYYETFVRLREALRTKFRLLVRNRTPIVALADPQERDDYTQVLDLINPPVRKHYECEGCRVFFSAVGRLVYLNDHFQLVSIMQEFLNEQRGSEASAVLPTHTRIDASPILPAALGHAWLGGMHFYAFSREEFEAFNANNPKQIRYNNELFKVIQNTTLICSPSFSNVLSAIEAGLYRQEVLAPLWGLHRLLTAYYTRIVRSEVSVYRLLDILQYQKGYEWLHQIKDAPRSVVLRMLAESVATKGDLRDMGAVNLNKVIPTLTQIANAVNAYTDFDRYQAAMQGGYEHALQRSVSVLKELGIPRALERQEVSLCGFNAVVWEKPQGGQIPERLSVTDQALCKLLGQRELYPSPRLETPQAYSHVVYKAQGTLVKFLQYLAKTEIVAIEYLGNEAFLSLVLTNVDDAPYDKVFRRRQGRWSSYCFIVPIRSEPKLRDIIAIVSEGIEGSYLAVIPGLAASVPELLEPLGTFVMQEDVLAAYQEHASSWEKLSRQIPLKRVPPGEVPLYGYRLADQTQYMLTHADGKKTHFRIIGSSSA